MDQDQSERFPDSVSPTHDARLHDPARLRALHRSGLMDSETEEAFDRAVMLATTAIGAPVGLVSLVDGQRQFFKAQTGLSGQVAADRQTPLSHSFCQYVTTEDRRLEISDARTHPVLRHNRAVDDLGVIAYLGVPVHAPDGSTLGSFCAIYDQPHVWDAREKEIMTAIAAMLETELALRSEMSTTRLLLKEMAHRVGNLFAIVMGMVKMTARHVESVDDYREALSGRIYGLQRAHDLVRPANPGLDDDGTTASLQNIISNLVEPHLHMQHEQMVLSGPTIQAGPKATTNLALIIHEVATNAAKYGALSVPEGRLQVSWQESGDEVTLHWKESGGPAVDGAPSRNGFGSALIKMTAEGPLGGRFESDWQPEGVRHTLTMKAGLLAD